MQQQIRIEYITSLNNLFVHRVCNGVCICRFNLRTIGLNAAVYLGCSLHLVVFGCN